MSLFHGKYIGVAYQIEGIIKEKLIVAFQMSFKHLGGNRVPLYQIMLPSKYWNFNSVIS